MNDSHETVVENRLADIENAILNLSPAAIELRDYFAAKAMQALLIGYEVTPDETPDIDALIAKEAYKSADAMLAERTKTP